MKRYILLWAFCVCFAGGNGMAAQDNMLFLGRNTPQKYLVNPAMFPENSGFFLSVPFIGGFSENFSGNLSLSDVFVLSSGKSAQIDVPRMLSAMKPENRFRNRLDLDLIHLGFRIAPGSYLGFSTRLRTFADIAFSRDIVEFIMDNPIGKNRIFNLTLRPDVMAWGEAGISFTQRIGRNFHAGVRIKGLMGAASVQSSGLRIAADKRLDKYILSGNIDLMAGNLNLLEDRGGESDDVFDVSSLDNIGFSVDAGISFVSDDGRLEAYASVSDWGKIFWSDRMSSRIVSSDPEARYEWIGVKNLEELTGGSRSFRDLLDDVVDEMTDCMAVDTVRASFGSSVPMTLQAGASYRFGSGKSHKVSGNAMILLPGYSGAHCEITAGYTYSPRNGRWDLMTAYTYKSSNPFNIGLGVLYRGRGFEWFLMTDSLNSYFSYEHARNAVFRLGMNFYWGGRKYGIRRY